MILCLASRSIGYCFPMTLLFDTTIEKHLARKNPFPEKRKLSQDWKKHSRNGIRKNLSILMNDSKLVFSLRSLNHEDPQLSF